jgi:hypothetical protein
LPPRAAKKQFGDAFTSRRLRAVFIGGRGCQFL